MSTKSIVAGIVIAGYAVTTMAVDGIAVSYHSTTTDPFGYHAGTIIRHTVKSDTVVSHTMIYSGSDARCVCISPSGRKAAFIRVSDGNLCVARINPSPDIEEIISIGITSWIDWPHEDSIYFTKYGGHVSVMRVNLLTKEIRTVGSFPAGIQQLSVSADTGVDLRGTAVLQLEGASFDIEQFDYRGWQIPDPQYVIAGCGTSISPDGALFTITLCTDSAAYHRQIAVWTWERSVAAILTAPTGEYWNRTRWSVNSTDWLISSVGRGKELLQYHDALLHTRDLSAMIRLTSNDAGGYDEGCDFWVGNPDTIIDTTGIVLHNPVRGNEYTVSLIPHSGPSHAEVLQVRAPAQYVLQVFAPNGESIARLTGSGTARHCLPPLPHGMYLAILSTSPGALQSFSYRFVIE